LIYQLAGTDHCGGAGALGAVCEGFESSSAVGMFKLLDLSHFTNFVVNSARANEFCTRIFGLGFQAYQGPTSPIVGVGDGKQFLMYVEGGEAAASTPPGRVDHVCLSIENFDVEAVISKLENCGISARENANITPPLVHWTSMRMPNRGGVEGGTPEVYFSDPDGIRVQLQHASYCGGGGYFGDDCSAHN
jgi:catechol 2,3-dioxygenase-like lactoylglutathione lyase family enzyme